MSQPKFSASLAEGLGALGVEVELVNCPVVFGRLLPSTHRLSKWLGYIDQFLLFPRRLRRLAMNADDDAIFVLTDNALAPWLPALAKRPHVVHCHDFLAQRSALGEFPENPTGWTGRQYQALIRRGLASGRAFISVSEKTRRDLHLLLGLTPEISEVVPNALNFNYHRRAGAIDELAPLGISEPGFVLHVGGNQWYKNRPGVIEIYQRFAEGTHNPPPLVLIGPPPTESIRSMGSQSSGKVLFLSGLTNEQLRAAYSTAGALLFPSLEEGFGWPPAEAQACQCPVITTDAEPMREVAGQSAYYIPRRPYGPADDKWIASGANALRKILSQSPEERAETTRLGQKNAQRFEPDAVFGRIFAIYSEILKHCQIRSGQ